MLERERQREILDAVAAGLIVVGIDRTIVYWNAWMATASHRRAPDVVGKRLEQVFPDANLRVLGRAVESAIEAGASTLLTNALHPALLPLKTRAGRPLLHDVMITPGVSPRSECIVQILDVTDSARRERFLRERQNARYDALVESAPDVILNVDAQGIIRLANPAAQQQFGYPEDELIGQNMSVLFENQDAWSDIWTAVSSSAASRRPAEVLVRRKDGTLRYFEVSAALWKDGTRAFVTAILRDVNDRRDAEIALRKSERESRANAKALSELNEVLQESGRALNAVDRRKNEFLATLAHELRNPLAPLRNGLQLLKLAKDDAGMIERTRHMMDMQLGQMVRLIDDLLDVSRINNDRIELTKELTTLDKVIRQAIETSGPIIDAQQHKLIIDLHAPEIAIEGDVVRLTQVFANLLNNAAKYTPRGGNISIKTEQHDNSVSVHIIDDGIGIPQELLATIFDMFMQVDNSLDRSQGGLGIGLSLVKRLVQLHGGSVEARSRGVGTGSEFVVRLPTVPRPQAANEAPAGESATAGKAIRRRILVVDDNEDSALSLAMILSLLGHDTRTAHDGIQALEVADDFRPDLALVDIGMPKLNGYETARRIRETAWGREMLLAALTGWGQEVDRLRSSDAGFDVHFIKPVNVTDIQRLLAGAQAPANAP